MNDARQQPADPHEVLVQDRDGRQLPELDEVADPREDDLGGRVLGDVVVGAGLQSGEDVGVVVPHREHQHRHARDVGAGPERPADRVPVGVRQVDVEDDDVRPDLPHLRHRVPAAANLVHLVAGPAQDRPEEGAVGRAVVDDQDGTHQRQLLSSRARVRPAIRGEVSGPAGP